MSDAASVSGLIKAGLRATATEVAGVIAAAKLWLLLVEQEDRSHDMATTRRIEALVFIGCLKKRTNNYVFCTMPASPVPIDRLDTAAPALWLSYWGRTNPLAGDPHTNSMAALEVTAGQDPVNVYTRQRVEGDLFRRDLILEIGLRSVIDFVSNRGGVSYSTPSVRLPAGDWISLGRIRPVTGVARWGYVGVSLSLHLVSPEGSSSSSSSSENEEQLAQVELRNLGTNTVVSLVNAPAYMNPDMSSPPFTLDATDEYELRLINPGSRSIIVSAWAMAVPHLDELADLYSSDSSASSVSSASSLSSASSASSSSSSSSSQSSGSSSSSSSSS